MKKTWGYNISVQPDGDVGNGGKLSRGGSFVWKTEITAPRDLSLKAPGVSDCLGQDL